MTDGQTDRLMDEWIDRHYKGALGLLVQNENFKLSKGYYHNSAKIKERELQWNIVRDVRSDYVQYRENSTIEKWKQEKNFYFILFHSILYIAVEESGDWKISNFEG